MTQKDFYKFLGKIQYQSDEGEEFSLTVDQMISLLDEGDSEDFFGTEGWRHILGWD